MQNDHYNSVRHDIVKRLVLQATFVINLLLFLLVLIVLTRDAVLPGRDATGLMFFLLTAGIGLMIHATFAFDLFERFIDWAVQKVLARESVKEKRKPKYIALGDDGELVETEEPLTYSVLNDEAGVNSSQGAGKP